MAKLGRDASGRMPRRIHHFDNWLRAAGSQGKGRAVVGAQRLRQAVFPKHPLKPRLAGGGVAQARHCRMAAVVVGEGQRVAALPVGQGYVALEVGAPALCRSVAVDQGPRIRGNAPTLASFPHQMVSLEDLPGRAISRPDLSGQGTKPMETFLRSKALCASFVSMIRSTIRCRRVGMPGSSREIIESLRSVDPIAVAPLVAGGPADSVVSAQAFLGGHH